MSAAGFKSLTRSLSRRLLVISLIGGLALVATLGLGLWLTLLRAQERMDRIDVEACGAFDRFFLDLQSDMRATADGLASRADLGPALLGLQTRNRAMLDLAWLRPDGTLAAERHNLGRLRVEGAEAKAWLEAPPSFGQMRVGPVRFEGDTPFLMMATPVTDDLSLRAGLLVGRVDLTALWNATLDIKVGASGYACLVDQAGQLVAFPNQRLGEGGGLGRWPGRHPEAIAASRLSIHSGLNGRWVLASARQLRTVPWFAILEEPVAEALMPFFLLGLAAAALLLVVGLVQRDSSRFVRGRIVGPLHGLRDAVRAMADGDLGQRLQLGQQDELGQLAHSFNRMAEQLQQAFAEQQRQIRALGESEARFNIAFDLGPVAMAITTTAEGRFVAVNRAFENLFGYDMAELASGLTTPAIWADPADRAMVLARLLEGSAVQGFETRIRPRSGPERWVNYSGQPVTLAGVPCLLSAAVDISDRRQAEAENARLQTQLAQSQKMESLGHLAGGIAHDMNNVLGAVLALASAHLKLQPAGTPEHAAFNTICQAAIRGGNVVKGLLSFARQSPGHEEDLDLNQILREEAELLRHTTLAKVRLVTELAPELGRIRGDGNALNHAFMNLCVNAVDAMGEDGTLVLRTRNAGRWVEVEVEDDGCGMPPEVLERALDPFFTTKPLGRGTGLGLAMVYGTVKASHGQLELLSEPGRGTLVRLRFPLQEAAAILEQPRAPEAGLESRSLSVLLVDDDDLVRTSTEMLLGILGHRVSCAASGEEALDLLAGGLVPELVILDMNMPGLGGAGTLPPLRARLPELPVLLATGRADQAVLDLVLADPHLRLLAKPYSLDDLCRRLVDIAVD